MIEVITSSAVFGVLISIIAYQIGVILKSKFKSPIFHPLLISIILVMLFILISKIDYKQYESSASYLTYLLTPTTVCLAVPLYKQIQLLKNNLKGILIGVFSGAITSVVLVLAFSAIFKFSHQQYVTLLPKSITTAIGIGVAEELGGFTNISAVVIIITGIFGNAIADIVFKFAKITNPIAKGVALGTSAHAVGTAKAIEYGEVEGAMSSLSIVVCGLMTVILSSIFAMFY